MNILECDSIMLEFGLRKILSSIYLKCKTGEVVGLLGRNGSGKSSLLKVMMGILASESRSVRINEKPILLACAKNELAYLPQHHFIPSFLKIREAFKIYGADIESIRKYFPELELYLSYKPDQLSGGTLRIFEVLLVGGFPAKFVLMDEPFSGIMPVHIDQLINYLTELKKDKGIVITDHLYRHIVNISDKMYVLVNGQNYLLKGEEQLIDYGYINAL